MQISKALANRLFKYDYFTGSLLWSDELPREVYQTEKGWRSAMRQKAGKVATTRGRGGRLYVNFNGSIVLASYIVAVMNGVNLGDVKRIEFKDGNYENLLWSNLRIVKKSEIIPSNVDIQISKYKSGDKLKLNYSISFEVNDDVESLTINERIREAIGKQD